MDPYRTSEHAEHVDAPRDQGIVGDVIAQFADPSAFYRELVQNAIDAGTPSVEVRLEYNADAKMMRVAVRDRGEGMTRDILENQLLVLFRSTKETDSTKIGKFGIGFASVLSPNPALVAVHSARDGRRLTLHLHRDLTYQLFDAGPATQTGTSVELDLPMPPESVEEFARTSQAALVRWCRHASVPITFSATTDGEPTRIDRPLGLDNPYVEVQVRSDDGHLFVVVGVGRAGPGYIGFFNHGLMLYESNDSPLGRLDVKLQDSRLGHTLSRDDVRRDAAFDRAIEFAKLVASRELPVAAARAIAEAADAGDLAAHQRIADAVAQASIELAPSSWRFPIVEPIGEQRSLSADDIGRNAWAATTSTPITQALAATGVPVVHTANMPWVAQRLRGLVGGSVRDLVQELTLVRPVEQTTADVAMLALLHEALDVAHRAPSAIVLAKLTGACAHLIAIAGSRDESLVDRDVATTSPFGRLRRPPLVLSIDHPTVAAARTGDSRLAASHLARAILLHYRLLDVDRSAALLAHTLDQLGVA